MAGKKDDAIPPVPLPPSGATPPPPPAVPPVESAPKTPAAKKTPAAAAPASGVVSPPAPAASVVPPPAPPAPANPYAQPTYAPQSYTPPPAGPAQGLSITSMILGIAGIFFGILFSIAAVITGHMGQKSQPYAKPFWLTGIITGYVGIGIGLLVIVGFILWFAFIFALVPSSSFYN